MSDVVRTARLLRACLEVLRESDEPLHGAKVLELTAFKLQPTPYELAPIGRSDQPRWENHLRWRTGEAATIGWLSKRDAKWSLTTAGEMALDNYDTDRLYAELSRQYREIRKLRAEAVAHLGSDEQNIVDAISVVDEGSWTSVGDLATHLGVRRVHLEKFIAAEGSRLPEAHRILDDDGSTLPDRFLSARLRRVNVRKKLASEGIEFDKLGRASQTQRLGPNDLAERLAELDDVEESSASARAWLVRGSSVEGRDMVPMWLHESWISLAGTNLRPLTPPVTRDQLKTIVEEDYQHKSYAARETKIAEFDAFVNRMRPGDYVITPTGGRTYLGRVTSDATYTQSADQRSNLRREIEWFNPSLPVPFANLPDPLPAKLGGQADVVDLTEDLAAIEKLLADLDVTVAEPAPQPTRELVFPEIEDVPDSEVIVSREWLQDQADLLWDRHQIIFYGPPGTGKTYLALELARRLTDLSAIKLVQFHPSYTYEDFFEGFRPVQVDDQLVFTLHQGPFRQLVEAAKQHPADPYILIIDEINRANLAKVFGELYFLLEYRKYAIGLLYSSEKDFTLPRNVFVIGTMNTSDRSIALVDAAMRRRFAFVELHPSQEPTAGVLRTWLDRLASKGRLNFNTDAADLLDILNERIEDHDLAIGPSYLMRESIYGAENGLSRVWDTDILPLLAEHHYGSPPGVLDQYRLDALRKVLANRRPDPQP